MRCCLTFPMIYTDQYRLTIHNVHYLLSLMRRARQAIVKDQYPEFLQEFFDQHYAGDRSKIPQWAIDALRGVGVDLMSQ